LSGTNLSKNLEILRKSRHLPLFWTVCKRERESSRDQDFTR